MTHLFVTLAVVLVIALVFATIMEALNQEVRSEADRLREALVQIARQKRTDELETEADVEYADFEDGFNTCVNVARAALRGE